MNSYLSGGLAIPRSCRVWNPWKVNGLSLSVSKWSVFKCRILAGFECPLTTNQTTPTPVQGQEGIQLRQFMPQHPGYPPTPWLVLKRPLTWSSQRNTVCSPGLSGSVVAAQTQRPAYPRGQVLASKRWMPLTSRSSLNAGRVLTHRFRPRSYIVTSPISQCDRRSTLQLASADWVKIPSPSRRSQNNQEPSVDQTL